jgi:hypothetical protein
MGTVVVRKILLSTILFLAVAWIWMPRVALARDYRPHSGYISSIAEERTERVSDMVVIQPPKDDGPTLRERIFNDKLSKEFRERYEEKFGRTEVQRVYNSPNRFTYYDDLYGFRGTDEQVNSERRRFGEFMVRRLAEWHFDNYAKNDPKVRPVWEAKERLSQVRVEVQQFRFDIRYTLSGNYADLNVINPWVVSKITFNMDPGAFGPTPVQETVLAVSKPLTATVGLDGYYYFNDGVITTVLRKALRPRLGTSLTVSTFTKDSGKSVRESVYLAGLNYSF